MAQEFTINSSAIETKINQLLPSQGGFGAGVDFSASTMVIPIVDLTESAEGSSIRQDLQRSFSHVASTFTTTTNTTNTIITTTGYFTIDYSFSGLAFPSIASIAITDGTTSKKLTEIQAYLSGSSYYASPSSGKLDVFLEAGDSITVTTNASTSLYTTHRQIADISGNLVNP